MVSIAGYRTVISILAVLLLAHDRGRIQCYGFDLLGSRVIARPAIVRTSQNKAIGRRTNEYRHGCERTLSIRSAAQSKGDTGPTIDADDLRILYDCANGGSNGTSRSPSSEVLEVLRRLEECNKRSIGGSSSSSRVISREFVDGTFELIFSSSVANLPLGVGGLLDGYMPNREIVVFDFEKGVMSLSVETLPFFPSVDIVGEGLVWQGRSSNNNNSNSLRYTVQGKTNSSEWTILYANDTLVAGKSSVTGYNVLRRC